MSLFKKFEEEAAPIPTPAEIFKEYSDSLYVCFYIDPNIYDPKGFTLSHTFPSNLSYKDFKLENNLHVFCVYRDRLLNYAFKLFKSEYNFKISYKFENNTVFNSNIELSVELNKIKFIYNAEKYGIITKEYDKQFKNPSYLIQYEAFSKVINRHDFLFEETKNALSYNLDMELFLYLLQNKKEKMEDLMSLLKKFPYLNIIYDQRKPLKNLDFQPLSINQYYNKLITIYSVIQDSI